MDPTRWDRIQEIFHESADRPPSEQRALLALLCEGDSDLEAAVLDLLEADARGAVVLDRGVQHAASRVFGGAEDDTPPLSRIGRYHLTSCLGEGGMGVVYLAEREDIGGHVALKVLRDGWVSPARRRRFAAEQRTLAQFTHPNIAQLYGADTLEDGTPWFAMEYVDGVPIDRYCEAHEPTLRGRLRVFREVCGAVLHAHQHLVVHRDLKPGNIYVTSEGVVKLLDFGIAAQLDEVSRASDRTETVFRLMTPAYAAPEQIRGERAGVQVDVYALGVVLYELLAGRRPFEFSGRTPGQVEAIVLGEEPERPSVAARSSPRAVPASRAAWADLDVLCLTAMHKDPSRRYASVEALLRDVDHFLAGEPLQARADTLSYRMRKFLGRNRRGVTAAAAATVLIAGLVAFYTTRVTAARNQAQAAATRAERIQRFMNNLFQGGDAAVGPSAELRVVTLLERGVQEARSLDTEPEVQADLYQTLGVLFQNLGDYQQAAELLQLASDRRHAVFGADHPSVVESTIALGVLRIEEAKLDAAETLLRGAYETARRALAPTHATVARATAALGKLLEEQGHYDQAIPLLDEAARLHQSLGGQLGQELAETLTELANAHFYAGHMDESEAINLRVLEMDRQMHGASHPNVADDLLNLGAIQSNAGRFAEAERYTREALVIVQGWYGADHPETASTQTILAQALWRQQKYDEAEALLRQALTTQERTYGEIHPRVAFALNELGMVALGKNDFSTAESSFGRALDIYRRVYDDGKHYRVGVVLVNVGNVHVARGEPREGERYFRDALALYGELLPANHLNALIARLKLGQALLEQQRYAEVEEELITAWRGLNALSHPPDNWMQAARDSLARLYELTGRADEAAVYRLASPRLHTSQSHDN